MKLLQTKDYLLLIDEESRGIEFGEIGVNMRHSNLEPETRNIGGYGSDKFYWSHKKIIAYYPLTKEAKELDLPLLPPFEEKIDMQELFYDNCKNLYDSIEEQNISKLSFYKGYKAAQTKQFSLDDMKKALNMLSDAYKKGYHRESDIDFKEADEIIQSLSTQQLPKNFIPEIDNEVLNSKWGYGSACISKIKTITNSEGKEVLVGTFKY